MDLVLQLVLDLRVRPDLLSVLDLRDFLLLQLNPLVLVILVLPEGRGFLWLLVGQVHPEVLVLLGVLGDPEILVLLEIHWLLVLLVLQVRREILALLVIQFHLGFLVILADQTVRDLLVNLDHP